MIAAARAFVDTNMLVYAFDDGAPGKQAIARDLVNRRGASGTLVISTQVLLEVYVVLTRKRRPPLDPMDAEEVLRALAEWTVVVTDVSLVLAAVSRARSEQLSPWDAMIVEAALVSGCRTLITEDLQEGRRFGSVVVENPFRDEGTR